jgi:hypothetical protein
MVSWAAMDASGDPLGYVDARSNHPVPQVAVPTISAYL